MAQGMWTKRFTVEGEVFYYNSTLQQSAWQPPANAVLHEAEGLQVPLREEVEASEADFKERQKRLLSEATPTVSQNNDQSHTQSQPSAQEQSTGETGPDIVVEAAKMKEQVPDEETLKNSALAEQLLSAVLPLSSMQQQAPRQPRSKRFKSSDKSGTDGQEKEESAQDSYRKMVNSYQALAGDNGEEGGKWLVR